MYDLVHRQEGRALLNLQMTHADTPVRHTLAPKFAEAYPPQIAVHTPSAERHDS